MSVHDRPAWRASFTVASSFRSILLRISWMHESVYTISRSQASFLDRMPAALLGPVNARCVIGPPLYLAIA